MAKSKPKSKKLEPGKRGPCHVRVDMEVKHRDKLRVLAAKEGLSMAKLARAVLTDYIERSEA